MNDSLNTLVNTATTRFGEAQQHTNDLKLYVPISHRDASHNQKTNVHLLLYTGIIYKCMYSVKKKIYTIKTR